jgi:hypothetical protein
MEENSPYKKVTFFRPEGCRNKGRPKLRWLDIEVVENRGMEEEST